MIASIEELYFVALSSFSSCKNRNSGNESGTWFITKDQLYRNYQRYGKSDLSGLGNVMCHEFDILGTGLYSWGNPINWSQDVRSGYQWPKKYYKKLLHGSLTGVNSSDIKIPWEVSRFQHLTLLAKAYVVTNEEKYAEEAVAQIDQWMSHNSWCYGVNWVCAMEVSIRACNWIWAWQIFKESSAWSNDFHERFVAGIWQHGYFIMNNLEDKGGIRTNHYLSDVVGLFFIGTMFPCFKQSEQWKEFGLDQIIASMDEMVYEDGVGFENSTGYHRLVTELFLFTAVLAKKNKISLPINYLQRLELMLEYILYCTRPDGRMPMVGDADDGRLFILADNSSWDRWDFRYLLSIGSELFDRADFKLFDDLDESVQWISF